MAALQRLALRGTPKATKQAARYTPAGGAERCGMCRHYVPSSSCARIEGPISAAGWCQLYSQQVTWRPRAGQAAGLNSGSIPSGVALDLSFMSVGILDPRISFTRASTATYFGTTGVIQTAAINVPRWDYDPNTLALRGLLIEEARTNVLLNSATLGTQSVTVTAQAYTLSFYGTGTITKSGTAAGALVGTGAGQRVSQTFTPTAGTLTLTVTGTVSNAQLEAGAFATSWISTTAAAATRAQEVCGIAPGNMGFYAPPGGTWELEFVPLYVPPSNIACIGQLGVAGSGIPVPMYYGTSPSMNQWDSVTAMTTANIMTFGAVTKATTSVGAGTGKACLNGGPVASAAGFTNGYPALATSGVGFLAPYTAGDAQNTKAGYVRRARYWPRVLTDAEMQSVTT